VKKWLAFRMSLRRHPLLYRPMIAIAIRWSILAIILASPVFGQDETTAAIPVSPTEDSPAMVGDSSAAPAWIKIEREFDEAESVERRLVVGTELSDVMLLEEDFRKKAREVAQQYLKEQLGGQADSIIMDENRLSSLISPRRVFVQRMDDADPVTFVRYGQLVFDEAFRGWALGENHRGIQRDRLMIWAASVLALVVILSTMTVWLRLHRRNEAVTDR